MRIVFSILAVVAVLAALALFRWRTKAPPTGLPEESATAQTTAEPPVAVPVAEPKNPAEWLVPVEEDLGEAASGPAEGEEAEPLERSDDVPLEEVSAAQEDGGPDGDMADSGPVRGVSAAADGVEWELPPVSGETLAFVRETFSKWRASDGGEAATADLRVALAGRMSREEVLAAAGTLMRAGSGQDRIDALWAVANEFGAAAGAEDLVQVVVTGDGEDADDGEEEPEWTEEDEREAKETHDVVALVSAGFEDPDSDVRQAAYEAAMVLSPERNGILLGQLLCSDSEASEGLRRQLMDELDGSADEEAISLFLTAMQSPDEATAAVAKRNLETIAGRTFADAAEAGEWLDARDPGEGDADEAKPISNE